MVSPGMVTCPVRPIGLQTDPVLERGNETEPRRKGAHLLYWPYLRAMHDSVSSYGTRRIHLAAGCSMLRNLHSLRSTEGCTRER